MATFLEMAQRVRQEAGIAGTGPISVQGQTGEYRRIVDWVASSWNDIQISKPNWRWMSRQFSFQTSIGKRTYTSAEAGIPSRFSHWLPRTMRLGLSPPNDETPLEPISYDEFRLIYLTGPQPQSRPVAVAVTPADELALGYTPDKAYTVTGEYQRSPQTLSADGDTPEMPAQFHEAIVYMALMKYARYSAAAEIYDDAAMNYRRINSHLQIHQLPGVTEAEALA